MDYNTISQNWLKREKYRTSPEADLIFRYSRYLSSTFNPPTPKVKQECCDCGVPFDSVTGYCPNSAGHKPTQQEEVSTPEEQPEEWEKLPPMGVSQWLNYGEKWGYAKFWLEEQPQKAYEKGEMDAARKIALAAGEGRPLALMKK